MIMIMPILRERKKMHLHLIGISCLVKEEEQQKIANNAMDFFFLLQI